MMVPIALCSLLGIALLIQKALLYRETISTLQRPLDRLLNESPSIVSPLFECVERGGSEEELSIVGTKQVREIERGLSTLALVAMIAPLMGFTGTVLGMIQSFMVISTTADVSPSMLANGIWEALITTAAGLFVAIPIHIGHHYLEKKADEIAFLLKEITVLAIRRRNQK